jgi:CheY-like chemotaxis protein
VARVLIVEDESTDLIILRDIVEASGHEVYLATGGEQALNLYMGRRIDVVVTDLQMPHMDGLELMEALQALFPDVAIIVVSGKGPELLAAAMDKGALVAFSKPVDPRELLAAIVQAAPDHETRGGT